MLIGFSHTYFVLNALSQLIQIREDALQEGILGPLPAEDHTGPQDNRMLEPELLDGIFHANLHPRVGHIGEGGENSSGPSAGDEHVRLHAGLLGRLGVLHAQVMVDLPLIPDPAGRSRCGADCVEDDRWPWREGGDCVAPFCGVAFFKGLQLGGVNFGESP